jgi:peptidylprolyl isomerase
MSSSATPGKPSAAPEKPAAPAKADAKSAASKGDIGPKLKGEDGKPVKTTADGLKFIVLDEGKGAKPKKGDTISAEYTGYLTDGTKFDSSKDHGGKPLSFTVGVHDVIPGWDEALLDMKVGERRKLIVPAKLAYGDNPPPGAPIPPGATLVFEVKLVKIGS